MIGIEINIVNILNKIAAVIAAITICLASSLFFPSITATSNLAFINSIKIKTIEVKIPNCANCIGEKYFGNTKENRKLII